jgi:hypothetical protein
MWRNCGIVRHRKGLKVRVSKAGLCSDSQMVQYYEYGTDHLFVTDGAFLNFDERILLSSYYHV